MDVSSMRKFLVSFSICKINTIASFIVMDDFYLSHVDCNWKTVSRNLGSGVTDSAHRRTWNGSNCNAMGVLFIWLD